MLKEYKNISNYKRYLIKCLYDLTKLNNGYVATYTNNKKLIYLCKCDSLLLLYYQNKLYFACPIFLYNLMINELNELINKYGTSKLISTSF